MVTLSKKNAPLNRPYFILNTAMSADGKIATVSGESKISDKEDFLRTHQLRAEVDAILVGSHTISIDNPSLTVRLCEGKNPIRIIVDSGATCSPYARVLDDNAQTIIFVSNKADAKKVFLLEEKCSVLFCGEKKITLQKMAEMLYDKGIRTVMVEGGGTLNWHLFKAGLIDEVRFAIAPVIFGGKAAVSVVSGEGFPTRDASVQLELEKMEPTGEMVVLTYKVKR